MFLEIIFFLLSTRVIARIIMIPQNQAGKIKIPVTCSKPDSIISIMVNIGTVFGDAITPIMINPKVKIPIPKYMPP